MCYDDNARPPIPPGENSTARGEDIVLTAADGNRFSAFAAHPSKPTGSQVVIYPDVRGLHQFYKELALRFAEVGIAAVAMDYFGRTAGLTARNDSFEFWPHVQQLRLPTVFADAKASLAQLQSMTGSSDASFTVGFCLGGSLSLYTGTENMGLTGIIGFYAGLSRQMDEAKGTVLEAADKIRVPVLGLFGGNDPNIPADQIQALDEQLDKAGVQHSIITYPGAPHSFFDRKATEFVRESADAWQRILGFIAEQTQMVHA
ncbi:MAG: dienelactone hydrolase family protein [Ktedonobacteraceae bacterium]